MPVTKHPFSCGHKAHGASCARCGRAADLEKAAGRSTEGMEVLRVSGGIRILPLPSGEGLGLRHAARVEAMRVGLADGSLHTVKGVEAAKALLDEAARLRGR